MTALEKIKKIAGFLRGKHGQEIAHKFELAVSTYATTGNESECCFDESIGLVWPKAKEIIDLWLGSEKERLYVSEVIDLADLKKGKLNLVYAPCGSGKTFFVENTLKGMRGNPRQNMLYLSPTVALVNALKFRGESHLRSDGKGGLVREWKQAGITAMTYAAFGSIIRRARSEEKYADDKFWNNGSVICADELAQGIRQISFDKNYKSDNLTRIAIEELRKRIANSSNLVVTVSATPKRLVDEYFYDVRLVGTYLPPQGYKEGTVERYYELDNLLDKLEPHQRGMIYIAQIAHMKRAVERLEGRGIHAVAIHALSNTDYKMDSEQIHAIESLEKNEEIPEDVQVLLINAAYETGLNIRPEKSHLDYIVVHDSNEDTQIQVRGRYRGDIGTVYYRKKPGHGSREMPKGAIVPYLDRRLTPDDKKELCGDLSFKDERGRTLGWRTVKPLLQAQGYEVLEKKSGGTRYTIISIGE